MSWQALTVVVDKAGHGAVESALEEAGALAVTTEDAADEPVLEPGIGETPLWPHLRVTGLFESGCERQAIHRQLAALDAVAQAEQLSWQTLEDQDWTRAWMDRFEPMDFGHGLWICPRGQTVPTDAQHVIELDPGLAFGTGTHPTTALCLRWLAANRRHLEGARVLDYGCGSGILGIAAAILGATDVVAVDHDPQALSATRANAAANGVDPSMTACLPGEFSDREHGFEVVLANILAQPLVELSGLLRRQLAPGGHLVLSGILTEQADTVASAYQPHVMLHKQEDEGWVCLSGRNKEEPHA